MSMRMSKRRHGTDGQVIAHPGIASTPFESALEAFLKAQDAAGHSKVTQDDYERVVKLFLRYMADEHRYKSIQEITENDIFGWLSHLRNTPNRLNKPYSSRTIETYCRNVLVFFNWLLEHHYLTVNPIAQVKLPKTEKALIRVFTEDELERLDTACDRPPQGRSLTPDERKAMSARDRAILWLLLSTGIRISELCGLRLSDIDWNKGLISVKGKGAKSARYLSARWRVNT